MDTTDKKKKATVGEPSSRNPDFARVLPKLPMKNSNDRQKRVVRTPDREEVHKRQDGDSMPYYTVCLA